MTKVEQECVAVITDSITLEPVALLLVRDPQLQPTPSLKSQSLLINAQPLTWNPHLQRIVVELIQQMLDLPEWVLGRLLSCILAEVKHTHKTSEVPPTPGTVDGLLSSGPLPVHRLCDELIAKDHVGLKPHGDPWTWGQAVQEQKAEELVDLGHIERLVIVVDAPTKTSTLRCRSRVRRVINAPLDKLRRNLSVEEVLRTTISDFVGQKLPGGWRDMPFVRDWDITNL
jgi:hypothetical protein